MSRAFRILYAVVPVLVAQLPAVARGDDAVDMGTAPLPTVTVIGSSPLPGTQIDADKIPMHVESVDAAALRRTGTASLAGALNSQLGSINLDDTLADPFQPDLFYRGFAASPVLGTPQGLAVYQNGVRINEAFGDAVNWDLLPDIAISRLDLLSADPVYGLNALGGAATLTMKDGFNYEGNEVELSGGSFKQRNVDAQIGGNNGRFGFYAAGRVLNEDGWHFFARDRVRQFYGALSEHTDAGVFDLTYTHADNALFGPGATPVQSLALDRRNVFTGPQANLNRLDFVTLDGSWKLTRDLSLQSVAYYRSFRQTVSNGNTTNYTACATGDAAGLLCQADAATPLTNAAGAGLPDISNGGDIVIGENDYENIRSRGWGASAQLHGTAALAGLPNQLTAGASADIAHIDFSSGARLGVIDPATLVVQPSDLFVDTPEGAGFAATPVLLEAKNRYYGFFATDTLDLTSTLSVTGSARYNIAQIDLYDQRGTNLNGLNRYTHLNPALGATWKLNAAVTAYGDYSRTNRAPTASEIECSDPLLPCLLPANLAGDPPTLKQVIADTYELGLRGAMASPAGAGGLLKWDVGGFRTSLSDDIYAISSSLSKGFFQNIGATRRQGAQASVSYRWDQGFAYLSYSYVDATFQSSFMMSSPSNPLADANGNLHIQPGDHLPGIPRNRIKAGLDYGVLPGWTVGGALLYVSSQFYRGDESNQNAPLPSYAVLDLQTTYRFWKRSELFVTVRNVFDKRYATYGLYSNPTGVGAPGIPAGANANAPGVDNRFQSLAAPRSVFGGIRIDF